MYRQREFQELYETETRFYSNGQPRSLWGNRRARERKRLTCDAEQAKHALRVSIALPDNNCYATENIEQFHQSVNRFNTGFNWSKFIYDHIDLLVIWLCFDMTRIQTLLSRVSFITAYTPEQIERFENEYKRIRSNVQSLDREISEQI